MRSLKVIESGECKIYGNATIKGNVSIVRLKVDGDLTLEGECKVQELTVNGMTTINGVVEGSNIVAKGGLILNRPLKAKSLKVYGELNTSSEINAEEVLIEGNLECESLLNAEMITIHTFEHSYCKEIGATTLKVERPMYHLLWLSYHKKGCLTSDVVEADVMKLENVTAKEVRGKDISLFDGCNIELVEYMGEFNKTSDSVVKELVKMD